MTGLLRSWRNYWFRPAPLVNLAVCRIIITGWQLVYLYDLFASGHVRQLSAVPDKLYDPLPLLHLLILPFGWMARPSFEVLAVIGVVTFVAGVLSLVGLKTRVSLVVFALGILFLGSFKYSFGELHHPDAVMAITLPLLALSPAGETLSLDDLRRRMQRATREQAFTPFRLSDDLSAFARWPLLMVQWLFSLIFFSAAISKLTASGLEWMNGHTLQHILLRDSLRWGSPIGQWLSRFHFPAVLLSWGTMICEGTFFLVLIVPRLAWFYVPLATGMVAGFYLAMHANFLQYVALFSVFVPWSALAVYLSARGRREPAQAKPEVLYDDRCPLCIRSMVLLRYADVFDRLTLSGLEARWPEVAARYPGVSLADCQREMHVVFPDGSIARGFFAFRRLLPSLPPLWPLLPLFHAPGAARLGPKIYRFVAANRPRFESCPDGSCPIHAVPAPADSGELVHGKS